MATSAFKSKTKRSGVEPEYIKNATRGKFVNTERGSGGEINLDDLALELFSFNDQSRNSTSIGRWANDTASSSSRRRGRSVSRTRGGDVSSNRTRTRTRRRSLSSSRQNEMDGSWNSSRTTPKTSSHRQIGRPRSKKDLSVYLDGYSSQSSALTDEESRDTRITQNGFEKIIRTVYTKNKADDTTEEMARRGMYEAMEKELGCAFQDIRTELNQDKAKHGLLTAMKLEEQCSMSKELQNSRDYSAAVRPSRDRKRITDRSRVSKYLIEEADKIIEDFVSSVEDTDISSFDGERSDCSSSFGGMVKSRNAIIREEADSYKSPMGSESRTAEMDGVILPWLQWETSGDGSLFRRNSVTPKAMKWDSEKETVMLHDASNYSISSSYGSWSPGPSSSATSKSTLVKKSNNSFSVDMEDYLRIENDESVLFQMYKKRNRISSGGLLLCRSGSFV